MTFDIKTLAWLVFLLVFLCAIAMFVRFLFKEDSTQSQSATHDIEKTSSKT